MKSISQRSHDGRELVLMLEGKKPLAVFHDLVFADHDIGDEIERDLAGYVGQGRLVRHEERDLWPDSLMVDGKSVLGTRLRLYALPAERWRIDAYLLLTKATKGRPWSDSLETFVGSLPGYTDEEIAAWIEHVHDLRGCWGAVPAYLKVSDADLEKLQRLGFRAVPPELDGECTLILSSLRPTDALLNSVYRPEATTLLRFGVDTKFALKLSAEQLPDAKLVRLPHDLIADLNLNLKSIIEIVRPSTSAQPGL